MDLDITVRRKICQLVTGIVEADEHLADAEDAFLNRIHDRFGVPREMRTELQPMSQPGKASQLLRELPQNLQVRVMALLVEAAVVDGHVDPRERALLLVAAAALGIDAAAVEERIAKRLMSVEVG